MFLHSAGRSSGAGCSDCDTGCGIAGKLSTAAAYSEGVAVYIDPPLWPAHGTQWSHLVSDLGLEELHAFAARAAIPSRGFEGDHYDVPASRYDAIVGLGAVPSTTRDILRILEAAGLRMRKRKGDKGIARVTATSILTGESVPVDLLASRQEVSECRVFAAACFVTDAAGWFAVAHSVRRQAWGPPGGWREGTESPRRNAVREIREEIGLEVAEEALVPLGYERWPTIAPEGARRASRDLLQLFRVELADVQPALGSALTDTDDRRWVDWPGLTALCGNEFWWPLAAELLAP